MDVAAVVTSRDRLIARCRQAGEVELSFSDDTDRFWFGRFAGFTTAPHPYEKPATLLPCTLAFDLVRPFAYGAEEQVMGIVNADTDIPLGSEPTFDLVLRIVGPATDPIVRYKNSAGETVAEIGLTVTLGASEWVELDMAAGTIIDDSDVNRAAIRDTDAAWPLVLDPADGESWRSSPLWPTLRCTSGTMRATYRKAY